MGDGIRDMTAEGIQIDFDPSEGLLRIDCDEVPFAHLRDAILTEVSVEDQLAPFLDGLRSILVRRPAAVAEAIPRRLDRGVRFALIALVLSGSLAVQVIGLIVVARWMLGLGR